MFVQPARGAMGCEFSERFCLSLLFLLLLLFLLGCCLRCWLGRPRRPAAQNSLVIFTVGETESLHGSDEPPWTPAQRPPPHLQTPGWSTEGSSLNAFAWNGSLQPPAYEELMKPGRTSDLSSRQDGFHRWSGFHSDLFLYNPGMDWDPNLFFSQPQRLPE